MRSDFIMQFSNVMQYAPVYMYPCHLGRRQIQLDKETPTHAKNSTTKKVKKTKYISMKKTKQSAIGEEDEGR